jgi:hypothetical protein
MNHARRLIDCRLIRYMRLSIVVGGVAPRHRMALKPIHTASRVEVDVASHDHSSSPPSSQSTGRTQTRTCPLSRDESTIPATSWVGERERRVSVCEEAPGFRLKPRERERELRQRV